LASYTVGQLTGGYYFYNINSGSISFTTPPPGTWYFSLQAREYVGAGGDGYVTRDWINFSTPERVAGGAYYRDEQIVGLTAWRITGSTLNLTVAQVNNICDLGASGSLRLDLWATVTPYSGGSIVGYRLGSVPLNPLVGGYVYNNINETVAYSQPPIGSYYVTLTLSEYHNGSYVIVDYLNYANLLVVEPPPSPPTAYPATDVTTTGFVANWSSVPGALGYRGELSTNSNFTSFVGGYQDVDVGNVTSVMIIGLSPGTTYYYRVRAYNTVGTSGNSGTIAVTTAVIKVPVTVQSNPSGHFFSVDGVTYSSATTFVWTAGSTHTISSTSPQTGAVGTQYVWSNWSDGGPLSHTVSPTGATTYTANFGTQYYLTMAAGSGGYVSPTSGWYDAAVSVPIIATPNGCNTFGGWTGSGSGAFTGPNNPAAVTMNGPLRETATFQSLSYTIATTNSPLGSGATSGGGTKLCGTNVTVTATTNTGFHFENWTERGTVMSTSNKYSFVVSSDRSLVANFTDVARPTNSIATPTAGQRWSNAVFTATGTARDNMQISNVFCQLNGSGWNPAFTTNAWTNWMATMNLTPGTNIMLTYAVDATGNRSATNTVTIVYVLVDTLRVKILGLAAR
jgi:hypothetical protein